MTFQHYSVLLNETIEQLDIKENGIYVAGWCQEAECELKLKKHSATTRCVLETKEFAECFACKKPSIADVVIAKSY